MPKEPIVLADARTLTRQLVTDVVAPNAARIDAQRVFPTENFRALADAGLLGLMVPESWGGSGANLTAFVEVCEEIGRGCASTAMCYLMHGCATAVIAAKATADQSARWLRPIAEGRLIATLAFSERGTGAHFYNPEIQAHVNGAYLLSGTKSFVTSGGHADLYLALVKASPASEGLDVVVLEKGSAGLSFDGSWEGLGMAGNSSVRMVLNQVSVPLDHAIGGEGAGGDLVFGVVAPTFLVGVAAVNIGIAHAASDAVIDVTNKAMQVGGGQGYSRGLPLERHLRDGRASSVMAPTTEVLKEWLGKIQCGIPLF